MVYLKRLAISYAVLFLLMIFASPAITAMSFADNAGSGYNAPTTVSKPPMIQEPNVDTYPQEPSEPAIPESEENPQIGEEPKTEEQKPDIPQEEPKEPAPETETSYPEKGNGKSNLSPGFLRNLFKKSK